MNTTQSSHRRAAPALSHGGIARLDARDNGVPASWPFTDDPPKAPLFVASTGEYPISGDAIRAFLHDGCSIEHRFRMPELLWSSFAVEDTSLCTHDDCEFCAPFRAGPTETRLNLDEGECFDCKRPISGADDIEGLCAECDAIAFPNGAAS